jgi:hypothetical protein
MLATSVPQVPAINKHRGEYFLAWRVAGRKMGTMTPQPGTRVQVRNAYDETLVMVAVSAPQAGDDFPVVWVCSEEEFERASAAGDAPSAIAWPLDAVGPT